MKVAVVGGGIAGLAAAWELVGQGVDVTVFEPGRLGGLIQTALFCGHPVDTGADAFLSRVPDASQLFGELGMTSELVAPAAGRALLWFDGHLRPLPAGTVLGAPARLRPLVSSTILSPTAVLRAGLDLVMPATPWPADMSVAALIERRFGRQVAQRLVDPLVGGIHAGRTEDLSATAAAPQLAQAARNHRSLLVGLRRLPVPAAGPTFLAPLGGMGRLIEGLVAALTAKGVTFAPVAVSAVRQAGTGPVVVEPSGAFDGAVIATPAAVTAALLDANAPDTAEQLRAIPSASVVLVTFAYPRARNYGARRRQWVAGAAPGEGRLMTACSFGSTKWPHWSDDDTMVLRVSAGRAGDRRAIEMTDEAVLDRLQTELSEALGTEVTPRAWRVSRWPDAFPQYLVGHVERVERIERSLRASLPSVALAGSSYRGAGIPACIASGRRAAATMCRPQPAGC